MKTNVAFASLLLLSACGTNEVAGHDVEQTAPASKVVTEDGHLGLEFPDGTRVLYPTRVVFMHHLPNKGVCLARVGTDYELHVMVRNTSEVDGQFKLRINGQFYGYFPIKALTDMEIIQTVPAASRYNFDALSDQTSARGSALSWTDSLTSAVAVSDDC